MIDFFATTSWYWDHLEPIWSNIPEGLRREPNIPKGVLPPKIPQGEVIVTASYADFAKVRDSRTKAKLILCEHGAGQTYSGAGAGGYLDSGTVERRGCHHVFVPGLWSLGQHRRTNPQVPATMVGFTQQEKLQAVRNTKPKSVNKVVFGWHWDCNVCNESKATWRYWMEAVANLKGIQAIGHGHPRELPHLAPVYTQIGMPIVPTFRQAITECDLYVVDNSSTAFEALALGIPVLLLGHPTWDRKHGLRFGREGGLFPECNEPAHLQTWIERGLANPEEFLTNRYTILDQVYSPRTGGAAIASQTLLNILATTRNPRRQSP